MINSLLLAKGDLYDKLVEYFKHSLDSWKSIVQLILISLSALACVVLLILAIINPKGRKKRKEKKIHALHDKITAIKEEISVLDEELTKIDDDVTKAEEEAQRQIAFYLEREKNLKEIELASKSKSAAGENKESDANRKKGASNGIADENSKRIDVLAKKITDTENGIEYFKNESKIKKDAVKAKRAEKENELNILLDKQNRRYKSEKKTDKRNVTEETTFNLKRRRNLTETEIKALEELRIARESYENAVKRREQAEENRLIALENAKAATQEKRKVEDLKKQSINPDSKQSQIATVEATYEEEPNEVQLIISDPDGNAVVTVNDIAIAEPDAPETITSETENDKQDSKPDDNSFVQVSINDPDEAVVFTHVDAEDGTVISHEEQPSLKEVPPEKQTAEEVIDTSSMPVAPRIEGFSPDEPSSVWKIVRSENNYTAYLIVTGRKIAHTDEYATVPLLKMAIAEIKKCLKKKRYEVIPVDVNYSFVFKNRLAKPVLYGETRFTKEASEKDALLAAESYKSEIRAII